MWNACVATESAARLRWDAAAAEEPAPVQGLDGNLEHELEAILNFTMRTGVTHLDASGDTWESPLENLNLINR